jgi:hypothetical protein
MRRFTQQFLILSRAAPAVVLALTVVALARPARAVTTLLDMNTDPVAAGWQVSQGAQAGTGTHTLSDGLMRIETPGFYELRAPDSAWHNVVNNATGWEIETRLRIVSSPSVNMMLWVHDNRHLNILEILPNALRLNRGVNLSYLEVPIPSMSEFRTIRMTGIGNEVDVYVDEAHVVDFTRVNLADGTRGLFFGDGYWSHASVSDWDYFRITTPLPEPNSATAATALGGLLLARRQRRRC